MSINGELIKQLSLSIQWNTMQPLKKKREPSSVCLEGLKQK